MKLRHTWKFITLGGSATALFGSSFLYFMWTFFFKRNIYTFIITGQKEDLYKRLAWLEHLHTSVGMNQRWHYLSFHHHHIIIIIIICIIIQKGRITGHFWCFPLLSHTPLLEYWKEEEREGGTGVKFWDGEALCYFALHWRLICLFIRLLADLKYQPKTTTTGTFLLKD